MPGKDVGPQHRGTIHIGCTLDLLERAYDDAKHGRPSEHPVIEMTIPSSVDRTLAPEGHHVISLFVQYAPYTLAEGDVGRREGALRGSLRGGDHALRTELSPARCFIAKCSRPSISSASSG
jgi:phytoene dehydrogenase-like protein